MIKRFFSAMLCLLLIAAAFSVNVSAVNKLDTKIADVKIYVEDDKVQNGDIVSVSIYIENITYEAGFLALDLPLTYDRSKLSFIKLDCIYPASWGPYGEFMGHSTPDEDPWYLRSFPEANDMVTNPAYMVTGDKQIGYKLTFKAVAEGEAFVAVEDAGNNNIMFVVFENDETVNYGGNGMKATIQIGGTEDNSSVSPVVSDDPSEPESSDPVVDSSADNSSEDVESSEDVSSEDVSAEDSSVEDSSAETGDTSVGTENSVETDASAESSEAVSEESAEESASENKTDGKDDDGGLPGFVIPVIIVVVVAALLGVGGFLYIKKKSKQAQDQD